jgi:hypothetical protein
MKTWLTIINTKLNAQAGFKVTADPQQKRLAWALKSPLAKSLLEMNYHCQWKNMYD